MGVVSVTGEVGVAEPDAAAATAVGFLCEWRIGGATGGLAGVPSGSTRRKPDGFIGFSGFIGLRRSVAVCAGSLAPYTGLTRGDAGHTGFFCFLRS